MTSKNATRLMKWDRDKNNHIIHCSNTPQNTHRTSYIIGHRIRWRKKNTIEKRKKNQYTTHDQTNKLYAILKWNFANRTQNIQEKILLILQTRFFSRNSINIHNFGWFQIPKSLHLFLHSLAQYITTHNNHTHPIIMSLSGALKRAYMHHILLFCVYNFSHLTSFFRNKNYHSQQMNELKQRTKKKKENKTKIKNKNPTIASIKQAILAHLRIPNKNTQITQIIMEFTFKSDALRAGIPNSFFARSPQK